MLRDIFSSEYVPTICLRSAEIKAVSELPAGDKDSLFPMFLLAPWPNSNELSKSFEKIADCYGSRPYFLGLDYYYEPKSTEKNSIAEYLNIRSETGSGEYFAIIEKYPNTIPVIYAGRDSVESFAEKIKIAEQLGRGFLFSVSNHFGTISDEELNHIGNLGHNDFAFHLDKGWFADPLLEELWYSQIVRRIFNKLERAAIVISSESFPRDFSNIDGVTSIDITPRLLFSKLKALFNNEKIIYGDWASTRPRQYKISSPPLPRIDYALRNKWYVARSKSENWNFKIAADKLIDDPCWLNDLNVWGSYLIKQTSLGLPFSITSTPQASAARINLHLHMQANFNKPSIVFNTDEPWQD